MNSVLIIEDEGDISTLYSNILRKEHFTVYVASNGKEGIQIATGQKPCVILLDLLMPELDGIATLRELRKRGCDAHVIILTASPTLRLHEGVELGIYAYLNKALSTPREVVDIVKHAVKTKKS